MSKACEASDCPFDGEPILKDRREDRWHFERRIGLDVIISFLLLIFAGIGYVIHQDTRQTRAEDRIGSLESADVRIEKGQSTQKDDLVKRLERVEEKIDRLVERRR